MIPHIILCLPALPGPCMAGSPAHGALNEVVRYSSSSWRGEERRGHLPALAEHSQMFMKSFAISQPRRHRVLSRPAHGASIGIIRKSSRHCDDRFLLSKVICTHRQALTRVKP